MTQSIIGRILAVSAALVALPPTAPSAFAASLLDGLTLWTSFDESAQPDFALGSRHAGGTYVSAPGKFGQGFKSSGKEVSWYAQMQFNASCGSLSFWYKPEQPLSAAAAPKNLFGVRSTNFCLQASPQRKMFFFMTGDLLASREFAWDYNTAVKIERIPTDDWTHIAVTWDKSTHSKIMYINGKKEAEKATELIPNKGSGVELMVGGAPGVYDEVMIWNRPLSEEDITMLRRDMESVRQAARAAKAPEEMQWTVYPELIYQKYADSVAAPRQTVEVTSTLANKTGVEQTGTVTYELLDVAGKPVHTALKVDVKLAAGQKQNVAVPVTMPHYGFFKLQATVQVGQQSKARDLTTFGCIPEGNPPAHPIFGAHVAQEGTIPELGRRLGIAHNRVHNMTQFTWWVRMQPTPDKWAMEGVNLYNRYRSLGYSNLGQWFAAPNWAVKLADGSQPEPNKGYPKGWVPTDNNAIRAYIDQSLKAFPDITEWEVWNEPYVSMFWSGSADQYVEMARVMSTQARSQRKDLRIYAQLNSEGPWTKRALSQGILSAVDGVAFHQYFSPDSTARDARQAVSSLHELIKTHGGRDPMQVPIIMSEGGISTSSSLRGLDFPELPPPSRQVAARDIDAARVMIQTRVAWAAMGVRGAYYYFLQPLNQSSLAAGGSWSLVEITRSPRPMALAVNAASWQIDAGKVVGDHLDSQRGFYAAAFERHDGEGCLVIWAEGGAELEMTMPGRVLDIWGNPAEPLAGRPNTFAVNKMPIYVRSATAAAEMLSALKKADVKILTPPTQAATQTAGQKPAVVTMPDFSVALELGVDRLKPIDLSAAANMGLADESQGDGKGGMMDEGPYNDLRMLQPGRHVWMGVPFVIGGKDSNRCVVTLRGNTLPTGPTSADVPVNLTKVRGLFFAHTANWASPEGQPAGHYVIKYADGTEVRLPVIIGKHVANWWMGHDAVPQEESRTIGFLHPQPAEVKSPYRYVRVWYWENPHLEKTITGVRMEASGKAPTLSVLGITAAQW